MSFKDHYKQHYGRYKRAPDFSKCCAAVTGHGEWYSRQCYRTNGHGPDGAYCKQHDPEAVEDRRQKSRQKHQKQWDSKRVELAGPRFLAVLRQIADGHNDPRGLATEVIARFEGIQ